MIKNVILFLLSPWRAHLYDFSDIQLPLEAELLIVSDHATLNRYVSNRGIPMRAVSSAPFRDTGYQFLSFSDISKIVEEHQLQGNRVYIHCDEETALESVAEINDQYHLDGMGIEETQKYRNKVVMKKALGSDLRHSKIPGFSHDAGKASILGFPLIGKPVALAGAIGVERINNQSELDDYAKRNKAPVIIEQFIEGDLYHCDGVVIDGLLQHFHASKYFSPLEYATKNMSYIGSELVTDSEIYVALERASEEVISKLACRRGAVHIEFIVNALGVYFVEIANRPAGGWIQKMYSLAYNHNIYHLHLYSSYPNFVFKKKTSQCFSYCCGIQVLRTRNDAVIDIELPPFDSSLGNFSPFREKWHGQKTNSTLDSIGELLFYSNDREDYIASVQDFVEKHRVIYEGER